MPFLERTLPHDPAQGSLQASGASTTGAPHTGAPGPSEPGAEEPEGAPSGPVRTQMVGESPDDDLGYDPRLIPTEPIPDDD